MRQLGLYFKQKLAEFEAVRDGFDSGLKQQLVSGLSGSAKSLFIAAFYSDRTDRTLVAVTHNLYQGQKLYHDLQGFVSTEELFLYPTNDMVAADLAVASPELLAQRIDVLNHLVQGNRCLVVVPIAGLKRLMAPLYLWKASLLRFKTGALLDLQDTVRRLIAIGYSRETMVSDPGQFSVRGGILDIFPLTEQNPLRIELFDDEIDSIRSFDCQTQRSLASLKESPVIGPARELLLYEEQYVRGADHLEQKLSATLAKVTNETVRQLLEEHIGAEIDALRQKQAFEDIGKYNALLYNKSSTLTDYLPQDALFVMDEISRIQEMGDQLDREAADWQLDQLQRGQMVHDTPLMLGSAEWVEHLDQPVLLLSLFLRYHGHFQPQNLVSLSSRSMQSFHGQIAMLKSETDRWLKSDYAIVFLASDKERALRMEQVLHDYQIDVAFMEHDSHPVAGQARIICGNLTSGFEIPLRKLAVITEREVFANKPVKTAHKGKQLSNAERLRSYNELSVGDYVVHVDHGIGRYAGVETLEVNGVHKDYLQLIYKGNDKLYVPVEHINQVQKYVSAEGKEPKIYSLGGSEWKKVKNKARSSIQNIADDLIKLYARREASRGYAFAADGPEQHDFESAFPYQETVDQLRAIEEIKKDMESERPMDRLLCGDVGYGKTEVALRAAFKAIADGKQVAFLVPTTILAQQHFETARERFEEFPVSIDVLSRFRSRKEKQDTLRGLKDGTLDFVIGTHRLLSKDVVFKNLGLLIVDEEQRFGVTHKEKIKHLKANVDVLTLTATPIPRTLHMSMLGVRDLSVIETPPENRFPVQTYVTEYSGALVRDAIERELARGGQVYFLYNRVETIQHMVELLSQLVPEATVTFAHGQMKETELEAAMVDFLDGTSDVLVSTTIIETGVDIPNVNTLIVYDADHMGLAQLYQLRGRVGRSNRVAYAYFTFQRDKVMNEVAEKRLQAIKEFTELGSGFKIAMRDLSIRGAGNLLGAEQHGFIDSVGFDLYSQMLRDAVAARKGDTPAGQKTVHAALEVESDAYIPATYIEDSMQKIDMYKRFTAADSIAYLEELQDEMIDRFGDYPSQVAELFKVASIRVLADQLMIEEVKDKPAELLLLFSEIGWQQMDRQALFQMISKLGSSVGIGAEGSKMKLLLKRRRAGEPLLDRALELLKKIATMQVSAQTAG
ncbi:MAG: transcription-repair coupling factor [Sporolactobacillus sp.]